MQADVLKKHASWSVGRKLVWVNTPLVHF